MKFYKIVTLLLSVGLVFISIYPIDLIEHSTQKQIPGFMESLGLKKQTTPIRPMFWRKSVIFKAGSFKAGGLTFKSIVNYPITLRATIWKDSDYENIEQIEQAVINRLEKGTAPTYLEAKKEVIEEKKEGLMVKTTGTFTLMPKTSIREKYYGPFLKTNQPAIYRIFCIKTDTKIPIDCSKVIQIENIVHNKPDVVGPLGPKATFGPLRMGY